MNKDISSDGLSISSNNTVYDIDPYLEKGRSSADIYGESHRLSVDVNAIKSEYQNPKLSAILNEHMDICDRETRRTLISLDEAGQESVLTSLTSKLYDHIVSKVDDIDYGDIPATKGDITKLPTYDKLTGCVTILRDLLKEYKQDTTPIDEISTAIANISTRKQLFERGFTYGVELPVIVYNNTVLGIVASISCMISSCIEFIKTPNSDSFQIALDKVGYTKSKNNMLYNTLKKFNKSCSTGEIDKALEHVIQHRVDHLSEAAVAGTIAAVTTVVIIAIFALIGIIKGFIFYFYYARVRVSDFFNIQADLLQMNAYNLEHNEAKDETEKNKIVSKQLKVVDMFRKMSNRLSYVNKNAEVQSERDIVNTSKKMKISDVDKDMAASASISALF